MGGMKVRAQGAAPVSEPCSTSRMQHLKAAREQEWLRDIQAGCLQAWPVPVLASRIFLLACTTMTWQHSCRYCRVATYRAGPEAIAHACRCCARGRPAAPLPSRPSRCSCMGSGTPAIMGSSETMLGAKDSSILLSSASSTAATSGRFM